MDEGVILELNFMLKIYILKLYFGGLYFEAFSSDIILRCYFNKSSVYSLPLANYTLMHTIIIADEQAGFI